MRPADAWTIDTDVAGGSIKSSTMGGSALKRTCIKSMRFSTASAERRRRAHGELSSQVVRSPRWWRDQWIGTPPADIRKTAVFGTMAAPHLGEITKLLDKGVVPVWSWACPPPSKADRRSCTGRSTQRLIHAGHGEGTDTSVSPSSAPESQPQIRGNVDLHGQRATTWSCTDARYDLAKRSRLFMRPRTVMSVFPDPNRFKLRRPNIKQHLAFGRGPHMCAGIPLAQQQLAIAVEELLLQTQSFEVCGEIRMSGMPELGPMSVPLRMTAACR